MKEWHGEEADGTRSPFATVRSGLVMAESGAAWFYTRTATVSRGGSEDQQRPAIVGRDELRELIVSFVICCLVGGRSPFSEIVAVRD